MQALPFFQFPSRADGVMLVCFHHPRKGDLAVLGAVLER